MNGVALTVVNLEKLEKWFYEEYLDSEYDNNAGNQSIDKFLTDEITGNKTKLVIYISRTPTVAEVPGWAGYTVDGGPPYPYYDNTGQSRSCRPSRSGRATSSSARPPSPPTTRSTSRATSTTAHPQKGCAVIADLVTLLSNNWHAPTPPLRATSAGQAHRVNKYPYPDRRRRDTTYNAAFFSGRDDLSQLRHPRGAVQRRDGGAPQLRRVLRRTGAA